MPKPKTPSIPELSPGIGFHLEENGIWTPKPIPPEVLKGAKFSDYLTIYGYKSAVFEMPDGSMWAQKVVVGKLSSIAKKIMA